MTSRQTGRRIASMTQRRRSAPRRVQSGARRRKNEPLPPKDLRLLLRTVACGGVFVLLVAAKLLLPARMAAFNEKLSAAMERNMDVQAVFSAVGRTFSGEGAGVTELYQAVFHPQDTTPDTEITPQAEAASQAGAAPQAGAASQAEAAPQAGPSLTAGKLTSRTVRLTGSAALEVLRSYRRDAAEALPGSESAPEETADASDLAYILYSQENLPDRVSMEQAILGFDYCAPVQGVLSSDFGYREHPTEGEERFHYGVDLAADAGTEVVCFADGTVTAVGESSSYGRYCVVAHEGGYSTLYAHCSRITVSSGAAVNRGQKIAEVGETGIATGPHLHFELQCQGIYLNPVYYVASL